MKNLTSVAQLELIPPTGKGRGGARVGAGRKAGEKSQVVRVPVGCLNLVMEIIERHKSGGVCDVTPPGCAQPEPDSIPVEDVEHFHPERAIERQRQREIQEIVMKYVDPKKRELLDMGVLWLDRDGTPLTMGRRKDGSPMPIKYVVEHHNHMGDRIGRDFWSGRGRKPPFIDREWGHRLADLESQMIRWGYCRVADL